jgi:hypothetical protein
MGLNSRNKRNRRNAAIARQEGKCYWCEEIMIVRATKDDPEDLMEATLEHLISSVDYERLDQRGNRNQCVAACRWCNALRRAVNRYVLTDRFDDREIDIRINRLIMNNAGRGAQIERFADEALSILRKKSVVAWAA